MPERLLSEDVIEVGRRAFEDEAIQLRDSRISFVNAANGIVCREADGSRSDMIRIPTFIALKIALEAMLAHLEKR